MRVLEDCISYLGSEELKAYRMHRQKDGSQT